MLAANFSVGYLISSVHAERLYRLTAMSALAPSTYIILSIWLNLASPFGAQATASASSLRNPCAVCVAVVYLAGLATFFLAAVVAVIAAAALESNRARET